MDWLDPDPAQPASSRSIPPLVVLFHGLEGSSHSPYARELMWAVHQRGWRGVVMHYRGCSGKPNRLPRFYHSADSAEIDWVLRRLAGEHLAPLLAVGVSLGGNLLLKWLGEQEHAASGLLCAAAAVCPPHDLGGVSRHLERGVNRIYTKNFLNTLIPRALAKSRRFPGLMDDARIAAAKNLTDYDNAVTAPVHGFRDAADYYARATAKPLLMAINVPTLILHARNDPFVPSEFLPSPDEVSARVQLEIQAFGGHVGFVGGRMPGNLHWLPRRLLGWFDEYLPST
jgi:predicted alpha/beta-fold hydrolase